MSAAPARYARALFELGNEEGITEELQRQLRTLGALLEENEELGAVLLQPLYPAAERRAVLNAVAERIDLHRTMRNFVSFLIDRRRLVDITEMENEFQRLQAESAGITRVQVRAAAPLSETQQERLARAFAARTGRRAVLELEVDPSLLGGLVAQVGDTVFDGSLRSRLETLRADLVR